MIDMYISAIAIWGCNFAPRNWAFCNGQIISIASNTALFSLLGTTFGGDGRTTFALPNMQSRIPLGMGQGPGLSPYVLGELGGEPSHTLVTAEMPAHTHSLVVNNTAASVQVPVNGSTIAAATDVNGDGQMLYNAVAPNTALSTSTIGFTGGSQPHPNDQPYLALNFCICTFGAFPPRS